MGKAAFLVAALGWGSLLGAAQDNADANVAGKVLALENVWNQAVVHRDTKALDVLFDNLLIYVEYDGRLMTKAEYLASVRHSNANPDHVTTEGMRAQVYGSAVVVTGIYREKGVEGGKPFQRRGRFVDTWVYKDGNWVCVGAQATLILHGRDH